MNTVNIKPFLKIFAVTLCVFIGTHTASADTFMRDLRSGSSGSDVSSLQTFLEEKGFLVMPPGISKGYFGQKTLSALIKYQRSINLPAYGFFGPMTRKYVNEDGANMSLRVTSPNGGETMYRGESQNITWKSPKYIKATYADISIYRYTPPCTEFCTGAPAERPRTIAKSASMDNHSYTWKVGDISLDVPNPPAGAYLAPSAQTLPDDGLYQIKICESGTSVCDLSDRPFTVSTKTLLKVCPDSKFVNKMPVAIDPSVSVYPPSAYYILKGVRKEIAEFDLSWVKSNCTVPEQGVY